MTDFTVYIAYNIVDVYMKQINYTKQVRICLGFFSTKEKADAAIEQH